LRITPITSSGNVISAAISPDGRFVVYVESAQGLQSLWLLQRAGGQTLRLIPDQAVAYWGHTFTRDGNSIYFGQRNENEPRGALYSISTLGGAPKRLLVDIDSSVSFSPDGREMTFVRNGFPTAEGSALMMARADGSGQRPLAQFQSPEFVAGIFFGAPAWSPDGERIATVVGRRGSEGAESRARLALVSVADGVTTTLADPGWIVAGQAEWLPDGKSLVVIARSADQANSQIWSVAFPGGEARRVTSDLNDHRIVSLTADGGTLVSITGTVSSNVWSVPIGDTGSPRRVSRSTYDGLLGLAFSATQRVLYTANVGGFWGLWAASLDGADRGPKFMLSEPGRVGFPAIAADGTVYCVVRHPAGTEIRAIARDGSSSRSIVRDVSFGPIAVTPDGRDVIYAAAVDGVVRLLRAGVAGGDPETIFERPAAYPALDPSGARVAFYYYDGASRPRLAVKALAGGPLLVDLPVEATPGAGSRLALRDEGIYFNTVRGDTANVWLLPANGGDARRVTAFDEQFLDDFAVSEDGATLAVARVSRGRDAYAISGFAGEHP
jgi:Tol biopolymer transport system component